MEFARDTDALCDLMLRIVAQIKTKRVQVATSSVNMTRTDEGVIYGITIDLEPPHGHDATVTVPAPDNASFLHTIPGPATAYGFERDVNGAPRIYPIGRNE